MAKGYIVDKDTGRQLYYGHVENKQKLINAGHTVVSDPSPNEVSKWDGSKWIDDDELATVKAKKEILKHRRRELPSIEDRLDALEEGGQAQTDMKAKIGLVKAKYPIT